MASTLVVNVLDLMRRPGSSKSVSVATKAEDFDFADSRIDPASDIDVELTLESSSTGIITHGTARVGWSSACRRCLCAVSGVADAEIDEAFSREVPRRASTSSSDHSSVEHETEPIIGDQIDFTLIVREAVLLVVPAAPLCRAECPGLCPQCGADLATTTCSCVVVTRDERWAALDALRGKLDDTVE